jgi:hypothetical protein
MLPGIAAVSARHAPRGKRRMVEGQRGGPDVLHMRAKVQGVVTLECVVNTDGSVGDVNVTTSLDAGLDEEAI